MVGTKGSELSYIVDMLGSWWSGNARSKASEVLVYWPKLHVISHCPHRNGKSFKWRYRNQTWSSLFLQMSQINGFQISFRVWKWNSKIYYEYKEVQIWMRNMYTNDTCSSALLHSKLYLWHQRNSLFGHLADFMNVYMVSMQGNLACVLHNPGPSIHYIKALLTLEEVMDFIYAIKWLVGPLITIMDRPLCCSVR